MPKYLTCDKCLATPATEDYDGNILCAYHWAEADLLSLRRRYSQLEVWVLQCWGTKLDEMQNEIARLQAVVDKASKDLAKE